MTARLPPLAKMLDLLPDAVCVVDAGGTFLYVSAAFENMLGYARADVVGRNVADFIHPDDYAATLQQVKQVMTGYLQRHFRNRYIHKDGHSVDIQWSARWHPDYAVRIAVAHEVTELRRAEQELEHRANHDPLTGLPNRLSLQHALKLALADAEHADHNLAILYLDLDNFKEANDTGGHEAGDQLLCQVAKRLQEATRQGDLTARVGGDEFVVLLPACKTPADAHRVADMLRERLRAPYTLSSGPFHLDASFGIACYPQDGRDIDTLLGHADQEMYMCKRASRSLRA